MYENKGLIQCLYETFGGTTNSKGYIDLDEHIGAIYGDAITLGRCKDICDRLKAKGFASTNVVYGIGSYTYQYITRDTMGFAMKATSVTINGVETPIFKDPITDDGTKKSAMGRVSVHINNDNGSMFFIDKECDEVPVNISDDLLEPVFENGVLLREQTLEEIRGLIAEG